MSKCQHIEDGPKKNGYPFSSHNRGNSRSFKELEEISHDSFPKVNSFYTQGVSASSSFFLISLLLLLVNK